jgi:hypothetical protein
MSPTPYGERGKRRTEQSGRAQQADLELAVTEREQIRGQQHRYEAIGNARSARA